MIRRRIRFFSLMSLVLFVTIAALCVRSYTFAYEGTGLMKRGNHYRYFFVHSESGRIAVKITDNWPMGSPSGREASWASCRASETADRLFSREERCYRVGGCRAVTGLDEFFDDSGGVLTRAGVAVVVPYVVMALPFLILPASGCLRYVRHQRCLRSLLCVHCGYDLRATPHRCPECGHAGAGRAEPGVA